MKTTIMILIPLYFTCLNAQNEIFEYANFKIDDKGEVYWQQIYKYGTKDLVKYLKDKFVRQEFTSKLVYSDNLISGPSNVLTAEKMPSSIHPNSFTCYIKVQLKENRYRVTVSDINFEPLNVNTGSSLISVGQQIKYSFEEITLKSVSNKGFRTNKRNIKILESFNQTLDSQFKPSLKMDEDW
ncbi:MAG: hypothetical protein AAF600_13105 [Bacteroidota bacterium]